MAKVPPKDDNDKGHREWFEAYFADHFRKLDRRRELGAPRGLDAAVSRANAIEAEECYDRKVMRPLRERALRSAARLARDLDALEAAEKKSPRHDDAPFQEVMESWVRSKRGTPAPVTVIPRSRRVLVVDLKALVRGGESRRGRPPQVARAYVEKFIRANGGRLSDRVVAGLLRLEGFEGAGDARERVRSRRRQGGDKSGRKS